MQTLARLFGRSPFSALQSHMAKVSRCVHEAAALFDRVKKKEYGSLEEEAAKVSKLEHEADLTKNDIRNHLPSGLFVPITQANLLEILAIQDNIADTAEDVAILLTLRNLEMPDFFLPEFDAFLQKNLEAFNGVHKIIRELSELLESSFGGPEAEKVRKMVDGVAYKEHESDCLQRQLLKKIFNQTDSLETAQFFLWLKVIEAVARISDESERLANRVRMTLEVR